VFYIKTATEFYSNLLYVYIFNSFYLILTIVCMLVHGLRLTSHSLNEDVMLRCICLVRRVS